MNSRRIMSHVLLGTWLASVCLVPACSVTPVPRPSNLSASLPPQDEAPPEPDWTQRWHRGGLSLGGELLARFTTEAKIQSKRFSRLATTVDFEDDLGFRSSTDVLRADAFYRLGRAHQVDVSYFNIERSSTRTLSRELVIGDRVFPINASATGFFNTQMAKARYRWAIWAEDEWEAGISAGLHLTRLGLGARSGNFLIEETFKANVPLPLFGLHGTYAFNDDIRVNAVLELLFVDLQDIAGYDIRGYVTDNYLSWELDLTQNLGVGVAINAFRLSAKVDEGQLIYSGRYGYQGLQLFLRFFF